MIYSLNCLKPIAIENPRYFDDLALYDRGELLDRPHPKMYVPCGKCALCLSRKRQQWVFRLNNEVKNSSSAYFITLTYNDENIPKDGRVNKRDCQLFLKRFRKLIHPFKVRYFLVSEYGEDFGRPHYHLLLFNFPRDLPIREYLKKTWDKCDPFIFDINDTVGSVTPRSINYVCKYCLSTVASDDPDTKTFMLCSRRPGIGLNYLSPQMVAYLQDRLDGLGYDNYRFVPLPRYYRDKVYDDDMKLEMRNNQYIQNEQDLAKYLKDNSYLDRKRVRPLWEQERLHRAAKIVSNLKSPKK